MSAPRLREGTVRFRWTGDDRVTGVGLSCDPAVPGPREFTYDPGRRGRHPGRWTLEVPMPPLRRFEYRFDIRRGDTTETVLDPDNSLRVPTAFGERSVIEAPTYAAPAWLRARTVPGIFDPLLVSGETDDAVPVTIWSPSDTDPRDPLPLLLVQDGPEFDTLASITTYAAASIAAGLLPPHRLALAHPVLRDQWYSGSPQYLRTVASAALATIDRRYAVAGPIVATGASLGGLTSLLLGLIAPEVGGVFTQSGSFFQPIGGGHEEGYRYFDRITRLVQSLLAAPRTDRPLRIGLTCGAMEENASNNRDMAAALTRAGHRVTHSEFADLHNFTAWRDSLHPHLTDVLRATWGDAQGWPHVRGESAAARP